MGRARDNDQAPVPARRHVPTFPTAEVVEASVHEPHRDLDAGQVLQRPRTEGLPKHVLTDVEREAARRHVTGTGRRQSPVDHQLVQPRASVGQPGKPADRERPRLDHRPHGPGRARRSDEPDDLLRVQRSMRNRHIPAER